MDGTYILMREKKGKNLFLPPPPNQKTNFNIIILKFSLNQYTSVKASEEYLHSVWDLFPRASHWYLNCVRLNFNTCLTKLVLLLLHAQFIMTAVLIDAYFCWPARGKTKIWNSCGKLNSVRLLKWLLLHVLVFTLPFEKVPRKMSMFVLFSINVWWSLPFRSASLWLYSLLMRRRSWCPLQSSYSRSHQMTIQWV